MSVSDFQTKGRREGKGWGGGWRLSLSKLVGYPKLLDLFGILFQDQMSKLVFYAQSTMTVISGRVSRSSDTKIYYWLGFVVVVVGWGGKSGGGGGGSVCLALTIGLTKPSPVSVCTHKKQPRRIPEQVTMACLTNVSSSPSYLYASPSSPSTAPFLSSGI